MSRLDLRGLRGRSELVMRPAEAFEADSSSLFWTAPPPAALRRSIELAGQVSPVIAEQTDDRLTLLCGYRRLTVLRELGLPVLTRLVEKGSALSRGLIYLADNLSRTLSSREHVAALRYFHLQADVPRTDPLLEAVLDMMQVTQGRARERLLIWLDLEAEWAALLKEGYVPAEAGEELALLSPTDRNALLPFCSRLRWSANMLRNFLSWMRESARRENRELAALLKSAGMADLLEEALSPKDQAERLVQAAQETRFPVLSRLRAERTAFSRSVTRKTGWRLEGEDDFESGRFRLWRSVASVEDVAAAQSELEEVRKRITVGFPTPEVEEG